MSSVKETARAIVERLPDEATWDELMYELYVKRKIDAGLRDADDGRTIPHEDIKARFIARKPR